MEFLQYNSLDASNQLTAVAMQITDRAVKRSTNGHVDQCARSTIEAVEQCLLVDGFVMRFDTNCALSGRDAGPPLVAKPTLRDHLLERLVCGRGLAAVWSLRLYRAQS